MQVIAPNSRSGGTGIYHLWVSLGSRQDFMKAFACSYLVVSALPSMTITVLFLSRPVLVAASLTTECVAACSVGHFSENDGVFWDTFEAPTVGASPDWALPLHQSSFRRGRSDGRVQLMARSVVLLMLMAGGLFAMGVMLSP